MPQTGGSLALASPIVPQSPGGTLDCGAKGCPIEILFGTSRTVLVSEVAQPTDGVTTFSDRGRTVRITAERGEALTLGRLTVIPPTVANARAPRCDDLQSAVSVTPETGFQLASQLQLYGDENDFVRAAQAGLTTRRDALVFVHGYNVKFHEAAQRLAQLVRDTGFCGTPFLFSWPAQGTVRDYPYDRESAEYSVTYFKKFLSLVRSPTVSSGVYIIAHSMGNLVLLRSLTELKEQGGNTLFATPIKEIILAAPDVDKDLFRQFVARTGKVSTGMTLYASSRDWAVWLSRKLTRLGARVGYIQDQPALVAGVETIDISKAGRSWRSFSHSAYGELNPIVEDIRALIVGGVVADEARHPPDRRKRFWIGTPSNYWTYGR